MTVEDYNNDWEAYKRYIEQKAKGRCFISNKNWLKLRDYHFKKFIKTVPHPYGFIFKMIFLNKMHKQIPCIYNMYYRYKRKRQEELGLTNKAHIYRKYR